MASVSRSNARFFSSAADLYNLREDILWRGLDMDGDGGSVLQLFLRRSSLGLAGGVTKARREEVGVAISVPPARWHEVFGVMGEMGWSETG